MINAYARKLGSPWLFDDLLGHFERAGAVASEAPLPEADAWICVRTDEAKLSPDPARTVVQVHDLWKHDFPAGLGAVVVTHPDQEAPAPHVSVQPGGIPELCRPIGALECFTLRERLSPQFTIGWVGRPRGGKSPRSPALLIDALALLPIEIQRQTRVLLVGEGLESAEARFANLPIPVEYHHRRDTPIEHYPALYHRMDCLVITSTEEAGPMPLFEALASGVYVVSSPVGWAKFWLPGSPAGQLYYSREPEEVASALANVCDMREQIFETRAERKAMHEANYGQWTLEQWVRENLELARSLVR